MRVCAGPALAPSTRMARAVVFTIVFAVSTSRALPIAAAPDPGLARSIDRHFRPDATLVLDPSIEDEILRIDLAETFGSAADSANVTTSFGLSFDP
jgi:hypothetical protein